MRVINKKTQAFLKKVEKVLDIVIQSINHTLLVKILVDDIHTKRIATTIERAVVGFTQSRCFSLIRPIIAEIAEDNEKVCCDGTTITVVRHWVEWFLIYVRHIVEAMKILYPGFSPIPDNAPLAERLTYFVRLVVNSGNWVHNRSAYLGAE